MTTGPLSKTLSERIAERRQQQLGEVERVTQRLLSEHENVLQQQLSDARRTTEDAIHAQSERLSAVLSESETQQRQQIEGIEQRLASAAAQAERLAQIGGIRSWTRPLAIALAVMVAVGVVTTSGLLLTDRLIDQRVERLTTLRQEIQRAEALPRLPQGVDIREIEGHTYLMGIDPASAWVGTLNDDTPVIRLTQE